VVNKGVSAYLFFWGGGRFNQSLVRRPLFGVSGVSGSGSGQVGSARGWNSGAIFFSGIDYGLLYLFLFYL